MNSNLYFHRSKDTEMKCRMRENTVEIDFLSEQNYRNGHASIAFWSTDIVDFKNKVLWAYEQWEREEKIRREAKDESEGTNSK